MRQLVELVGVICKRKNDRAMFDAKIHGTTFSIPEKVETPANQIESDALDKRMNEIMSKGKVNGG